MRLNEVKEIEVSSFHPKAWGFELLLDCKNCKTDIITNKEKLIKFVRELVEEIDMVAHGEPLVKHFPNRDPGKDGFSLVQLIETSSITCHCVDKTMNAYIDIFSCKDFSYQDAAEFVEKHLKPDHIRVDFLTRDA